MAHLYAIPCTFQLKENEPRHKGLAICTDPDTVETFIFPNGMPYTGKEIWTFDLHHFKPWAKIEL